MYKHGNNGLQTRERGGKGRRYVPRLSIYMMVRRYEGTWWVYRVARRAGGWDEIG